MDFSLEQVTSEDGKAIIDICNYYVENTFAAYPENKAPYEFFEILRNMSQGYPFLVAKDEKGRVLGFGFLHPHNPMPAFSRTAEITYFISPEHTRSGVGKIMLDCLLAEAGKMGITSILASISSLNEPSMAFHKKNGFRECGRFIGVGRKKGRNFDVVWMQRMV